MTTAVLDSYRVLELSSSRTAHCGQVLAHLGADVIAIEPPGGSDARFRGSYYGDAAHPERSLTWWAFNTNKRSIVLDIETKDGRERFLSLVKTADFVIEGFAPGHLDSAGLGYELLAAVNPGIIVASITPFGQTGPKAHYAASDLTLVAASSVLSMYGDPDRPPVRTSAPLAYQYAGGEAVIGCLIALLERARSGRGQRVDVSTQAAVTFAAQSFTLAGTMGGKNCRRAGIYANMPLGWFPTRKVYQCRDGQVLMPNQMTEDLRSVVCKEGYGDETLQNLDTGAYIAAIMAGRRPAELDRVQAALERFCLAHTKEELHELARQRRLIMGPVYTMEEVVKSPQLAVRGYWAEVEHPELGRRFAYPAAFAHYSESSVMIRRRAPLLGEHTQEIVGGDSTAAKRTAPRDIGALNDKASGKRDGGSEGRLPLDGINVIDLTRVMAGPTSVRYLADYGATVVRVDAPTQIAGFEFNSFRYINGNAGKYSLMLDLRSEKGRELFLSLVRWADVVVENFTPRVMDSLGLGYEALCRVKPDIIMVSTCLHGHTGPWSPAPGAGDSGASIAGITELLGWPDRSPAYPGGGTDCIAPKFVTLSMLAALDYRRRTGKGQFIDVSQIESSLIYFAPAVLDYTANGRMVRRDGNRDADAAPHGVFPCKGDDRWVAIAVETEGQWECFCRATGHEDWLVDERLRALAARKRHEDELEKLVGEWTSRRTREEVEGILQAAGVPASVVFDTAEMAREPQLNAWGHFQQVEHVELGKVTIESCRIKLSRTPACIRRGAPTYGQHNHLVLSEILGLSEGEIADIVSTGTLG